MIRSVVHIPSSSNHNTLRTRTLYSWSWVHILTIIAAGLNRQLWGGLPWERTILENSSVIAVCVPASGRYAIESWLQIHSSSEYGPGSAIVNSSVGNEPRR